MASPFTDLPGDSIAALGEVALIQSIRTALGEACPPGQAGGGNDCAVLALPADIAADPEARTLITVDALIYGRHFDDTAEAAAAGAKLVNRNLSDIASMGGRPGWSVISLTADKRLRLNWLDAFCRGMSHAAQAAGLQINGGDVSGGDTGAFIASMSLVGWGRRPVAREAARPGDRLLVTGRLGGSLLGRHLTFEPRLREGAWLARHPAVRAMIDVTDGLAKDLPALLAGPAQVHIDAEAIPVSADAERTASQSGRSACWHACHDGEDYELAIAVDPAAEAGLVADWAAAFPELPLTAVGTVTDDSPASDVLIDARTGAPIFGDTPSGTFRHFG